MKSLAERWHRNVHVIEDEKPVIFKRSWKPLTAVISLDDITITPITSEYLLKAHGNEMKHCIGGYTGKCIQNEVNIIELIDKNNEKSTLELGYNNDKIVMQQHRSYCNGPPPAHHLKAAADLVVGMNNGSILLNPERLQEIGRQLYTNDFPYDVNNLNIQETIYQIYKNKKILPAVLIAADYQTMLQKSQLGDYIEEVIAEEYGFTVRQTEQHIPEPHQVAL